MALALILACKTSSIGVVKTMHKSPKTVCFFVFLMLCSTANASLISDTVSGCFGPLGCGPETTSNRFNQANAVISLADVEFTGAWDQVNFPSFLEFTAQADFDEDSVLIRLEALRNLGGFGGLSMNFYGLDWVHDSSAVIEEVVVDPNNSLGISNLITGPNAVLFSVDPSQMQTGEVRTALLTFVPSIPFSSDPEPVPAPASIALLVLGLFVIRFLRRSSN